jgi:hypothetical protein
VRVCGEGEINLSVQIASQVLMWGRSRGVVVVKQKTGVFRSQDMKRRLDTGRRGMC